MGFNLVQIVNKFLNVRMLGSSAYRSYQMNIGQTAQLLTLDQPMNNVMVTNDGSDFVTFALNGLNPLLTAYDNLDPSWTYTGTWSSNTNSAIRQTGTDVAQTNTSGSQAVFNPNTLCTQIGASLPQGSTAGIVQLDLSSDGGVTWQAPSNIPGVTRSDGATGTGMNTFDEYSSSFTGVTDVLFTLPTSANWLLRVSYTGTKNAGSSSAIIYLDAGKVGTPYGIIVKSGETQGLSLQCSSIKLVANSGTQPVRLVVSS